MSLPPNPHRADLVRQTVDILNQYSDFTTDLRVTFSEAVPGADGQHRIAARLARVDGVPFAESRDPRDGKLARLKDQTVLIRPFYLPKMAHRWEEEDANDFTAVDFDYAAIIGYGPGEGGRIAVTSLYFLSTEALLYGQSPDERGVWKLRLATYFLNKMSLDPRRKFAKFLYLAERMGEALEYQYDTAGHFFSNP